MKGSCLCGAIQFEVDGSVRNVGNCHCSMCRKLHGAPFATYGQAPADALTITRGEEHVRRYESSEPVVRRKET